MTNPIADRYEVLDTLGRGSFGRTLLAREFGTEQKVAIKALHTDRADTLKAFEMFEREATVLRNLRHQGIPAVVDSFHAAWDGSETAFLVMEYMEGPTLEQLIAQQHSFSTDEVLTLILDLAGILEYLHERVPSILHRDIKPANVILRNGRTPVLVDFGAVRNVFRSPDESGSTVVGTYGYMPYEQYMGQATPASDLYALGATMLHLLTGRPPSDFLTDQGRLEVPEQVSGGARVRALLTRLLAPAAADRFQSANELRRALVHAAPRTDNASLPVVPATSVPNVERAEALLAELPPAPRTLTGTTLKHLQRNTPSTWGLLDMEIGSTSGLSRGAPTIALYTFLSVVSVGILPLMFGLQKASRRRRMKPFFVDGRPAVGHIQKLDLSGSPFGGRAARVTYEFEADGQIYRGADQLMPRITDRWREGDAVPVLYLVDRDYDSIVVMT